MGQGRLWPLTLRDALMSLRRGRRYDDTEVQEAIDLVERMDFVPKLEAWREEDRQRLGRHAGGRHKSFPDKALVVAMVLGVIHEHSLLATVWCRILFYGISPSMRTRLGVPDPPDDDDGAGWKAVYRNVRHRFRTLLEPIDPSPFPKDRRLSAEEFEAKVQEIREREGLTDDVLAVRYDRLTYVVNAIIEPSLDVLNRQLRDNWDGNVGVDATPIPAFARAEERAQGKQPRGRRKVVMHSSDPDAGLYVRASSDDGAPRSERKLRDIVWAFEATLVVVANNDPHSDHRVPPLAIAMAPLHAPGTNVGQNAVTALASVRARGYPTGWLGADRAYSNAQPEHFQLPIRALGYEPVLDYMVTQLGVKDSNDGAVQVEGAWYCSALPDALANATIDFRQGRIDETTWQQRVAARIPFLARPKDSVDAEGHQRWKCPASPGGTTVRCELKPDSETPQTRGKTRIPVTDALRALPPLFCTQQTITIPPEAGAKLAQKLLYGSPEHRSMYAMVRNTNEGFNGIAKDGARSPLGDPSRRRIRGVAAQSIFAALSLMATNLQQIESFLARAEPDAAGGLSIPRPRHRSTPPLSNWLPATPALSGAPPP